MTAGGTMDWRQYPSTLALVIHMGRELQRMLEATHAGDADVTIEAAEELQEMLAALLLDFGIPVTVTVPGLAAHLQAVAPEAPARAPARMTITFVCARCAATCPARELEIGPAGEQWCAGCLAEAGRAG